MLKKILHTGDIHVFRNKRHQEHKEVFAKLCKTLTDEKIDLLYVGGDVVDSKARLSPEQVEIISDFLRAAAAICPVIMIPGNHDVDLKRQKSLDSLTPIVDNITDTLHPIYYLRDTGIYTLYNIDWAVWSCLDDLNPFENNKAINYCIGCFHGPIQGASTDAGWDKFQTDINVDTFKDCNAVFLNDIHKTQYFRNNEIAYSGSLIQVKIDEDENRGVMIWEWDDVQKKYKPNFLPIFNDFGFKTFEISDIDKFDISKVEFPTDKFIGRLLYTGDEEDFSSVKFNELKKQIKAKQINEVVLQKRFKKKKNTKREVKTTTEKDFFTDFFKTKLACTDSQLTLLKDIDTNYNKLIDNADYQVGEYFIEELEIENFLSYGPNNIVKFTDLQGLIGLFAPNTYGKTNLLSALMFCLFNKTPKNSSSIAKLINDQTPEDTKAFVQAKLTIAGASWRIKRTIIPGEKPKVKLEVYETVDGAEIPRHEESRPQTDTNILRKLLGDEQIFLTTILCTQKNSTEFVDSKNAERLDLIMRFLGILVYDQKLKLADEDAKAYDLLYGKLREELDKLEEPTVLETTQKLKEVELEQLKIKVEVLNDSITTGTKVVKGLNTKIQNLNLVGFDKSLEELEADQKKSEVLWQEFNTKFTTQKEQIREFYTKWNSDETLKGKFEIWTPDEDKYKKEQQLIFEINAELKQLRQHLQQPDTCGTCGQSWLHDKEKIKTDVTAKEEEVKQFQTLIDNHKIFNKQISALKKQIETCDKEISLYESKIELYKERTLSFKQQIILFKENEIKIKKKEQLEIGLKEQSDKLDIVKKEFYSSEAKVGILEKEIQIIKENVISYNNKITQLTDKEDYMKALQLYKKGMHRTGIPSLILETHIPDINSEINAYISDLFDFKVQLELKDNNLDIFFLYESLANGKKGIRDIVQASGMEGTVINLAIRAALTRVSMLPKPSMLMLDEPFTDLDESNMDKGKQLLQKFKNQYYNIIIISHLEDLKDLPEHIISLEKENGVTRISS